MELKYINSYNHKKQTKVTDRGRQLKVNDQYFGLITSLEDVL